MTRRALAWGGAAALALAGCGGGERQDADEPSGNFEVEVVKAEFPQRQKLAKRSDMEIVVRNAGDRTIPNINVTVKSFDRRVAGADPANPGVKSGLADPARPIFVVNKAPIEYEQDLGEGTPSLVDREVNPPRGSEAGVAHVDTYALGPLPRGKSKTFRWSVTAVVAGPYRLSWRVNAGLEGKAKAVLADGGTATGVFKGEIADRAFKASVDEGDGTTILREGKRIGPKPPDRSNGPNDD